MTNANGCLKYFTEPKPGLGVKDCQGNEINYHFNLNDYLLPESGQMKIRFGEILTELGICKH